MTDNAIFPAQDAIFLSMVLEHASGLMPTLTTEQREVMLHASRLLADHGRDTVVADAITAGSLARLAAR
jgi:hypothetical protein